MSELRKITVQVVDSKSRAPIQGVGVTWKSGTIDNTEYLALVSSDPPTNQQGVVEFFYPKSQDVTVAVMGRRFGYLTHYQRFTTSLGEFTPDIPQEQWLRRIERGADNVTLTFELQPVPRTRILVLDGAGKPIMADIKIQPSAGDYYQRPIESTDALGVVDIAIRPVLFDIKVLAETQTGLKGETTALLSKTYDAQEQITVQVK